MSTTVTFYYKSGRKKVISVEKHLQAFVKGALNKKDYGSLIKLEINL